MRPIWILAPLALAASSLRADTEFFEKKIRPLLVEHCHSCHGEKKQKGGLRLDSAEGVRKGGETGATIADAVRYAGDLKMPPTGKLKDAQIADLARWVANGAEWPNASVVVAAPNSPTKPLFTDEQRRFWAFQPVRDPALPEVRDAAWPSSPIDRFILAGLEAKGLRPAKPADKRSLLRRVSYDLKGLPPTPEQIQAFLTDPSPDAFAKVVDGLLASPAYGERWARHWLDVARYADSNGLDENTAFANAWRYRDYVVRSLNADEPYDQFVREQIAGDLLPRTPDGIAATGFLVLGPKLLAEPDKQKMVMDIVDEQIDVVGKAFLGLTISCARCHDHKFDPIPTRDYYGLAGVFKSTKTMATLSTVARAHERSIDGDDGAAERARVHAERLKKKEDELKALVAKIKKSIEGDFDAMDRRDAVQKEVERLKADAPPTPTLALAVRDEDAKNVGAVKVHIRGNHLTLGDEAPRVFPRIIAGESQVAISGQRSGRLEFAEWIASPANPLTARVMVNRVWQHHFGEGIVRSPDNFGRLGERPTHPELLDWLATSFVREGWSLKKLHREIVLSSAYRMSTARDANAVQVDPDNRLLSRFPRLRLEAEAIRDGILAVAGTLDPTVGGDLGGMKNFEYVTNDQSRDKATYDRPRRSLYLPVVRNSVFDFFQTFDFVEPSVMNGKRAVTVVAPQALYLMNSAFAQAQARAFVDRLFAPLALDDASRVGLAYELAYGRFADEVEVRTALAFVRRVEERLKANEADPAVRRRAAWAGFCQMIFASNEFIYLN